jgi:DNA-binding transcriptional MerR regulator
MSDLTIRQMCDRFAVTPRLMRFYEVKAVLSPRRDGNRRFYGPDQVAVMQRVIHWRSMGLTVDTMRRVLGASSPKNWRSGMTDPCLSCSLPDCE